MPAGPDHPRASAIALMPTAVIALVVLLLALLVSGNQTGTIVVERVVSRAVMVQDGKTLHPPRYSLTTITETSVNGELEGTFSGTSVTRPGFQYLTAGQAVEFYDAAQNTIYATTEPALERAFRTQASGSQGAMVQLRSVGEDYVPGRTSVFEQELRSGRYRVARQTTIAGRPALELVQTHARQSHQSSGQYLSDSTVYVTPGTLDPIAEVVREKLAGADITVSERWRTYRVMSATPSNQWLVSLTARHPDARVVHGAGNYIRGGESET